MVVATEVLLLDEYQHAEYFNRQQFDEYVVRATPLPRAHRADGLDPAGQPST